MQQIKRSALTEKLSKFNLALGLFFMTSIRAVKDNQLQIEVAQNRLLGGRKRTLLGALNKSDDRFGNNATLLFDWIKTTPEDFLNVFPNSGLTLETLEAIAATWNPDAATGPDALVYPSIKVFDKLNLGSTEHPDMMTPIINVTEITESQIRNGEFFTESGMNQQERIRAAIEEENNVMKTGSDPDADYIVHPLTGDRIFRYTRTNFVEENPVDKLIEGKMTLSAYKKAKTSQTQTTKETTNPESIKFNMSGAEGLKA